MPQGKWFAVGIGGLSMSDEPNTIVVDGEGHVEEGKIGDDHFEEGRVINTSLSVLSNRAFEGR